MAELIAAREAADLRDQALRLLAIGVGDHTPIEVREQVAEIARRLATAGAARTRMALNTLTLAVETGKRGWSRS